MFRTFFVAQTKAARYGWPSMYRRMCSANGVSSSTADRQIPASKARYIIGIGFGTVASFGSFVYFHQQRGSLTWNYALEGAIRTITSSQVRVRSFKDNIPRDELFEELKDIILFPQDAECKSWLVSVTGNHMVGKSQLLSQLLNGRKGVLHIHMSNETTPQEEVSSILGIENAGHVALALAEAERRLGHKPILLFDIHERVTDARILDAVSGFAKTFGYDKALAKVVVMASIAATADHITGDGRKIDFFVPEFTRSELDSVEAKRVFEMWYGKPVPDSDVDRIFDLVGGRIGDIKDILLAAETDGLDNALAWMERRLVLDLERYDTIDRAGGFGPKEHCLAGWLAHEVAGHPFEQCFPASRLDFDTREFGIRVREKAAHPIYYHPGVNGYCARSPFVHRKLASLRCEVKPCRPDQNPVRA
mmetsp:Transcript_36097/g.78078  ORF Transcript_36097/g.78078 Transcript_36097/m.78078 type:complete len:420 (+) Transcript_36097:110-1369(+)